MRRRERREGGRVEAAAEEEDEGRTDCWRIFSRSIGVVITLNEVH